MEWVIGIASGLVTFGITEGGTLLWRRKWNPIVWTLHRVNATTWTLTRVSRRPALVVYFRDPTWIQVAEQTGDGTMWSVWKPPGAWYQPDEAADYDIPVPGRYTVSWIERDKARSFTAALETPENHIDIRRRDVVISSGLGKKSRRK